MPPVGFEPTISAGERPQTYALDCAATGTGVYYILVNKNINGNKNLEDLSIDVKIYKIFLVKIRRKIQVWYNKGGQLSYIVLTY
jgi:hypothetical protein